MSPLETIQEMHRLHLEYIMDNLLLINTYPPFLLKIRSFFLIVLIAFSFNTIFAQCPIPSSCTYTATSGTNYIVNAGETLCINSPTNYSSGTITLNGGTVNVASGATLSTDINPGSSSTIDICGTLSGTRKFNNNATINNYGSSSLSIDFANGGTINNYLNSATLSMSNINVNGAGVNNYGTGVNLSMSSWNKAFSIANKAGASMTVTSSPTIFSGSSIVNDGTLNWSPQLVINSTATITNNGIFNVTNGSNANFNGAIFNNNGTTNFATGPVFQAGSTVNNNAGATMNAAAGKLDMTGSSTFNNSGALNIQAAVFQGSSTFNNNASGTLTQASGLFDVNGGTINNSGAITPYDLKMSSGALNMNPNSVLTIAHQISTMDLSINTASGCSYIDLGGPGTIEKLTPNQPLTSGAGISNICGKVPYKNTDANNIAAASNTNPIQITLATNTNNHLANGIKVYIIGATGNTAANGLWTVANWNAAAKTFDLVGSDGTSSGAYAGGGVEYYNVNIGPAGNYLGYSGCSNPCVALPVTLIDFTAKKLGGTVALNWTTSYEKNNQYFIVERSIDGFNFEAILTTKGSQNSHGIISYSEIDFSPVIGKSYYRLKQIDYNGNYSYSSIAVVDFELNNEWIVFPNPSLDGSFTILSNFTDESIMISITDVTGRSIRKYEPSDYHQEMLVHNLSKGIYIITLQNGNDQMNKKLIVQ
jgi:hypothetical protein